MSQQTAVEWLYRWSNDNQEATIKEWIEAFEQAKEMEKEQIKEAFKFGVHEGFLTDINYLKCDKDAEYYYKETYNK